ncbi:MAG: two-component regulator propeller domain-containing protein [Acidobacteriota bacterium]|nr:two-component regulator propeller domain-containing protein [Acidobacteriota bacterium]
MIFAILALSVMLPARIEPFFAAQLPVKNYTTNDGLPQDRIKHIVQDSRGFVWFSTAGLSRFDGHRFFNFGQKEGLPHRSINFLLETRAGAYWVATNGGGVARFNAVERDAQPINQRFTVYVCGENTASQRVNVLFEDRAGVIWAGTDNGLFKLAPGETGFTRVAVESSFGADRPLMVWTFAETSAGDLWIGTSLGLLRRLPDGRIAACRFSPSGEVRTVSALLVDPQGRLWIGYRNGLVVVRPLLAAEVHEEDKTPWRTLRRSTTAEIQLPETAGDAVWLTAADGLAGEDVLALAQTADGRVWIGSSFGLSSFADGRLRRYSKDELPLKEGVAVLAADRAGYLWIGTNTSGAYRLSLNGFLQYGELDGVKDLYIPRLGEDDQGRLYTAAAQWTIYSFDGAKFTEVRPNLPARMLSAERRHHSPMMRDHLGEWWVSTPEGIYRFPRVAKIQDLARVHPLAVYTERDGLARNDAFNIFEDAQGDLWFFVFAPGEVTLTRWERTTGRFIRYGSADGLPAQTPVSFADDGTGGVWIGFRDGGLARFADGRFVVLTETDGLPKGDVNALHRDRNGKLWVMVTPNELGWIETVSAARPQFVRHPKFNSIIDHISGAAMLDDDAGRIYFYPGRGLARFDPQTGSVTHFNQADGVTNHQLRSAFRDRQGSLWFGTEGSLLRLPPIAERAPAPPSVFLSTLHVAGVEYAVPPGGTTELRLPKLTPEQSKLDIEFLGLGIGSGDLLRFQYKLEGADADWSAPTDQRRISYANLSGGDYRFLVRALGANGLVSETAATISFTILPLFYLRWWFIALVAVALAAVLFGFERIRVARLLEIERVRMRIATDLHDDIGSGLSRIAILSEVIRQRIGTGDLRVGQQIASINGASQELVDAMSDIVWAINPQKEHLTDLAHRCRRFASDMLSARNIEFRFRAPDEENNLRLGAELRREVYLIFKECINNLARHSQATLAEIDLDANRRWLTLTVKDNGCGFDVAATRNGASDADGDGNGLPSIQLRAKRLGGSLEINSATGQGTTVILRVPMNQRHWLEKAETENPRLRHRHKSDIH